MDATPGERAKIGALLASLSEGWEDLDGFSFEKNGKTHTVQPAAFAMACEALRIRFEAPDEPDDTREIAGGLAALLAAVEAGGEIDRKLLHRRCAAALAHLHRLSAQVEMAMMLTIAMKRGG